MTQENAPLALERVLQTRQIRFDEVLLPGQGVINNRNCPLDGELISILMAFPLGSNLLVDVSCGINNRRAFPIDGYIALNDAAPLFQVSELVTQNDLVWVDIQNTDGANPHRVVIVFTFKGIGS